MDTSSGRMAVGVLLQNRVGMVFDLGSDAAQKDPSGDPVVIGHQATTDMSSAGQGHSTTSLMTIPFTASPNSSKSALHRPQTVWEAGNSRAVARDNVLFCEPSKWDNVVARRCTPTAVYNGLGSPDDVPRSIAICPQRKCIAFGCRLGIELHWVDTFTGSDLNRWFPLAVPSDHLYFLPQRPKDTSKKLRLVSSAAGPSSGKSSPQTSHSVARRQMDSQDGRRQSFTRLFFGNLPFPPSIRSSRSMPSEPASPGGSRGILRTMDCDHYQAIPLSDGTHILFTDPSSGFLCLGSDAPLGGPTKLLRKVIFKMPGEESSIDHPVRPNLAPIDHPRPVAYNAAPNLEWGVRVVVAYDNGSVVFYNVPADIFERLRHFKAGADFWDENAGVAAQSDLAMDMVIDHDIWGQYYNIEFDQPPRNSFTDYLAGNAAAQRPGEQTATQPPFRSLLLHGTVVTVYDVEHGESVKDIAVDCSQGGVRIWIFLNNGLAKLYDIYTRRGQIVERFIADDSVMIRERDPGLEQNQPNSKANDCVKDGHIHFAGSDGANDDRSGYQRGRDIEFHSLRRPVSKPTARLPAYFLEERSRLLKRELDDLLNRIAVVDARHEDRRITDEKLSIEILTDWAGEELGFRPYIITLDDQF